MKKYFILFILAYLIFTNGVSADTKATSNTNIIKNQVDKATSSIDNIISDSVSPPILKKMGIINSFRIDTLDKISTSKAETNVKIDEFKKSDANALKKTTAENNKVGIDDATERPITYLKLFFLSILSFIFGSQVVFYLVIAFVLFLISRAIYRKIRNR